MKIVFVVLHYENLSDTKECLDSLIKYIIDDDVRIVVVDNGSLTGRIELIRNEYNNPSIIFIRSDDNLGFAKGNNLGFRYAKYEIGADIIILCNNDLIFDQKDFVKKIVQHFYADRFDVAGSRIMSLIDGKNQNPVPVQYKTIKMLDKGIIKFYILYFLSFFCFDAVAKKIVANDIEEYHPNEGEDFQLFGACLIFASKYIEQFDGLYDKTFMYLEESILKERVNRYSLSMKYYNDIEVMHKEGASTVAVYGKRKKKRQFYYKNSIKSCWLLRSIKKGAEV